MTTYSMTSTDDGEGSTERALRWIGDLDHPFYSDERNRYVWYEASAIAFQMLFLGNYFFAGLVLWIGGGPALPYTLFMFAPTLATAAVFQTYLKRKSAEYWPTLRDLGRRRGQLVVAVGLFLLTGIIRATADLQTRAATQAPDGAAESFFGGMTEGAIAGVVAGALAGLGVLVYKSRQQSRDEAAEG